MGLERKDRDDSDDCMQRAREGDAVAIAMLFQQQRPRLKKMVMIRMDRRLLARIDASDVLQDCWLDCTRRFPDFVRQSSMSFFQWLRFLTTQRLTDLHRKHLEASMRAAGQEISLYQGGLPAESSVFLAEHLMGLDAIVVRTERRHFHSTGTGITAPQSFDIPAPPVGQKPTGE